MTRMSLVTGCHMPKMDLYPKKVGPFGVVLCTSKMIVTSPQSLDIVELPGALVYDSDSDKSNYCICLIPIWQCDILSDRGIHD